MWYYVYRVVWVRSHQLRSSRTTAVVPCEILVYRGSRSFCSGHDASTATQAPSLWAAHIATSSAPSERELPYFYTAHAHILRFTYGGVPVTVDDQSIHVLLSLFVLSEIITDGIGAVRQALEEVSRHLPKDEHTQREYAKRFLEVTGEGGGSMDVRSPERSQGQM